MNRLFESVDSLFSSDKSVLNEGLNSSSMYKLQAYLNKEDMEEASKKYGFSYKVIEEDPNDENCAAFEFTASGDIMEDFGYDVMWWSEEEIEDNCNEVSGSELFVPGTWDDNIGSSFLTDFNSNIRPESLEKVLGPSLGATSDGKSDYNWVVKFNGDVFSVYDYKGDRWHIGGSGDSNVDAFIKALSDGLASLSEGLTEGSDKDVAIMGEIEDFLVSNDIRDSEQRRGFEELKKYNLDDFIRETKQMLSWKAPDLLGQFDSLISYLKSN